MDQGPSFSISISQINSTNANRTYDSDDEIWAENRSKLLHDTLAMKDKSVVKSKTKVGETPQKRRRKATSVIFQPTLPKGMNYVIKKIPAHPLRFGIAFNFDFANEIKKSIKDESIELFKNTIFGPYLNISKCNFQGQITKCLLLLEFSIKYFAIVTGLKCKGNVKNFSYPQSTPSRLIQRYFPDATIDITKSRLIQRFLIDNWETTQDAVQMAILYFVHTFMLCQLGKTSIPIEEFLMIEDGRQDFNLSKHMYCLFCRPYALNVWTYECASILNSEIIVKATNGISRICNLRIMAVKSKLKHLCPTFSPSSNKRYFEDFSTSPLGHFFRRSSRVFGTSSPPSPKRRKKIDTPKTKVSEPNSSEQLNVSINQSFSMSDEAPILAANVSFVHVSSQVQKDKSVSIDIEELKQHIKNYVSNDINFFKVYA
ncbi:hypothetical protein R3W88_027436 [Solanum pinnatisectum]|uniref:DUF1985 domain-containing protein n=1 Tax=Solanum pinnatisectum TaxID=50273 RepID=A0AAV9LG09_9SOLN|nr:hypothetical protein R3W88_027436 [Solanum pinnatisectum]